jgi:hypothetical protein
MHAWALIGRILARPVAWQPILEYAVWRTMWIPRVTTQLTTLPFIPASVAETFDWFPAYLTAPRPVSVAPRGTCSLSLALERPNQVCPARLRELGLDRSPVILSAKNRGSAGTINQQMVH